MFQKIQPYVMSLNRVHRLYRGGKLLDRWQGIEPEIDSNLSEDLLVTTVEYIGKGEAKNQGLSMVSNATQSNVSLKSLLIEKETMLGKDYCNTMDTHPNVLVRVGDSNQRLILQCHPNKEYAKKYLDSGHGKTEAWFIADTREIDGVEPCIYCGFKRGMTRSIFERMVQDQDINGILKMMHRIEVKKGDSYIIPAGMPHAMGGGSLFIEFHQPCDYTFRIEKVYNSVKLSEDDMHYGIGFKKMFDLFDYTTYSDDEIIETVKGFSFNQVQCEKNRIMPCLTENQSKEFSLNYLSVDEEFKMPSYDSYFILVALYGDLTLTWDNDELFIKQGRAVFIPAYFKNLRLNGSSTVLLAYPPRLRVSL